MNEGLEKRKDGGRLGLPKRRKESVGKKIALVYLKRNRKEIDKNENRSSLLEFDKPIDI